MSGDSEDPSPSVTIECPECGTTSKVPLSDAAERLDTHNERVHDGADVARLDPVVADRLADILAEEMGIWEDSEV
ncbi:hypothetical protein [Halanaeroarchaeum sp. HSR-CO]|uniref:hypothetical protein n=1 Tax=Halanaeroarchaeum sp. HSR-CO TaxID=2866382 RepID=UPI00217E8FA5|nr:hypothetical protein [Halanaeroarchaeum sp. HSR-CO]